MIIVAPPPGVSKSPEWQEGLRWLQIIGPHCLFCSGPASQLTGPLGSGDSAVRQGDGSRG